MRNFTLLLLLIGGLSVSLYAEDKDKPKKETAFTQHSAEVHVTPAVDYFIFSENEGSFPDDPYDQQYPFIGFGFGAQYIYRPVEVFGISTGIDFKMQGRFSRTKYPMSNVISSREHWHDGIMTVPVYFHLYKKMTACTFEFATGPEFNFPLFRRSTVITYLPNGDEFSTQKETDKVDTDDMRENASLGISIFLGGELNLCEHANLFLGPQIRFLDLVYFDKDINEARKDSWAYYPISLGLKMGFRFH